MRNLLPFGLWGVLLGVTGQVEAQPLQLPEPLYAQNFEQNKTTWYGVGDNAKVSLDETPENVKEGQKSLRFDYQVAPGQASLLLNSIAPPALATLQSISFWVKVDHNTSLAFVLQEDGGGRFGTIFTVNKDQWQKVELSTQELALQVGGDQPPDENGQLDLEKIQGLSILDSSQFFAQAAADPKSPVATLLGLETGPRTLLLDDFVLSSKPLSPPIAQNAPNGDLILDDFIRPQANWMRVGDVALKTLREQPPETGTLQADYTQQVERLSAFAKLLTPGVLAGKTSLSFQVASQKRALLIIQLEETSGGKYNAATVVSAGATPTLTTLPFADFKPADDSKDNNDHLDLGQVKQLLILDASSFLGMAAGENTLWLKELHTTPINQAP